MADYDVNVNLSASVADFQAAFAAAGRSAKAFSASLKSDLARSSGLREVNAELKELKANAAYAATSMKTFGTSTATAMKTMSTSVASSMRAMQTSIRSSSLIKAGGNAKNALFGQVSASIAELKGNVTYAGRLMNSAAAAVGSGANKMATAAASGVGRMATAVGTGVTRAHTKMVTLLPSIGAAEKMFVSFGKTAQASMAVAGAATQAGVAAIGRGMASVSGVITAGGAAAMSGVRRVGQGLSDASVHAVEFGKRLKGDMIALRKSAKDFMSFDEQDMADYSLRWGSRRAMINGLATDFARFGAVGVAALGGVAWAATQWESSMAGVAKAAELSAEETATLSTKLLELSLIVPGTAEEIANVAENAGQLGVPTAAILDFTEVMIAMGSATNLTSEQASDGIARLMNIMGKGSTEIYNYVENIGSVIVKLGNTSAATEKEIVNMAHRIGAAAVSIDIHTADVLAYATAISELGVRAEAGGTAISRTFRVLNTAVLDAGDDLAIIADTAGYATKMIGGEMVTASEQFAAAWDANVGGDAAYATADFIEGLHQIQVSGGNAAETLRSLGIRGERQVAVIMGLVANHGSLRRALDRANEEWEANKALMDEAAKRYETTASRIAMARNALNKFAVDAGAVLLPILADIADGFGKWLKAMDSLPDALKSVSLALIGTTAGLVLAISALAKMAVVVKEFQALEKVGGFIGKLGPALGAVTKFGMGTLAIVGSFAALLAVVGAIQAMFPRLKASADDAREAIAKLATTGDMTKLQENFKKTLDSSEVMKATAKNISATAVTISGVEIKPPVTSFGQSVKELDALDVAIRSYANGINSKVNMAFQELDFFGDLNQFERVRDEIKQTSEALAQMAGLGRGKEAAKAFAEMYGYMQKYNMTAQQVFDAVPEYTAQIKDLLVAYGAYSDQAEDPSGLPFVESIDDAELLNIMLGKGSAQLTIFAAQSGLAADSLYTMSEAAMTDEERIKTLTDAVSALVVEYTNLKVTEDSVRSSLRAARELLKDKDTNYKGQWDKESKEAEALHSALNQVATSYQSLIEAQLKQDDGGKKATRTTIEMKQNLLELATGMTGSAAKAKELVDQFEIWPSSVLTTMYVQDEAAAEKLQFIKDTVDNLPPEVALRITGKLDGPGGIEAAYNEAIRSMQATADDAKLLERAFQRDKAGGLEDDVKAEAEKAIAAAKTALSEAKLELDTRLPKGPEARKKTEELIRTLQASIDKNKKTLNVKFDLSSGDKERVLAAKTALGKGGIISLKTQLSKETDEDVKQELRDQIDKYNAIAVLTARLVSGKVSEGEKTKLRKQIDDLIKDTPLKVEPKVDKSGLEKVRNYLDDVTTNGAKGYRADFEVFIDPLRRKLAEMDLLSLAEGDQFGNGWLAKFYTETDEGSRSKMIDELLAAANNNGEGYKAPVKPVVDGTATAKMRDYLKQIAEDPKSAPNIPLQAVVDANKTQLEKSKLLAIFNAQSDEWKATYYLEPDKDVKKGMLTDLANLSGEKVDFEPVVPKDKLDEAIAAATKDSKPTVEVAPNVNVTPESISQAQSDIAAGIAGVPATVKVTADTSGLQAAISGMSATAAIYTYADPGTLASTGASIQGVASAERIANIKAQATNIDEASGAIDKVASKYRSAKIHVYPVIHSATGTITIGADSITVKVGAAYGGMIESLSALFGKFGTGGEIKGYSPHIRADNIPTMLTAGEYVHQVPAVRYYGAEIMQALNEMRIPKSLFGGYAYGGMPPAQKTIPGYAYGGSPARDTGSTHSQVTEYNFGDITVDANDFEGINDLLSFVGMLRRKHRQAGARR